MKLPNGTIIERQRHDLSGLLPNTQHSSMERQLAPSALGRPAFGSGMVANNGGEIWQRRRALTYCLPGFRSNELGQPFTRCIRRVNADHSR